MKVLTTAGLTKLIELIKNTFLSKDETTTASTVTLATVATSGSYNDLTNKPTIPTVNNATLTIQKNGTTVNTFTANASSNVTANITVPTQASDIGAQATLVSGTNIKTINNNSILGSGNISVDSLPSQTGQSGKYLTTNGTTASWNTVVSTTITYWTDDDQNNNSTPSSGGGDPEPHVH